MKYFFSILLSVFSSLAGFEAHSQTYPDKPIKLIVPFPPGGTVDVLARKTARAMEIGLKQPIVIENRTGANGAIAVELVMRAPPDGYTMLFNSASMVINQVIYPNLRYNTLRDFIPISEAMAQESYLLLVNSDSPFNNLAALLAAAKQKPGTINYGTPGVGNGQHLLMETLAFKSGTQMMHVPYKGIPDMVLAVIRGDVSMIAVNPLLAEPHIKSGKLRALAQVRGVTSRAPAIPEIPSIAESVPGFTWTPGRFGFFFPAGTPAALVTRINTEVAKALDEPDLKEYLKTGGFSAIGGTPQEFYQGLAKDIQRFTEVAKIANITGN
jgi:tripartite-type tricarboxylate transporter receptor subunit TctC